MHTLCVGMTESGKSTLAKLLAKRLHGEGKAVAILEPLYDPGWVATYRTTSIEEMASWMEGQREAFVFVDECGEYFNDGSDKTHSWFATRSRHYGHSVCFISQRAIQVPKTMRDQCSRLFLFTSSRTDGVIHSEEWNKDVLETCNQLPQFHFFMVDRYHKCERMEVVDFREVRRVGSVASHNDGSIRNRNRRPVGDSNLQVHSTKGLK